jgi:hypothetical protein
MKVLKKLKKNGYDTFNKKYISKNIDIKRRIEMKNFLEIITGSFRENAEYKAYRKLLESLPNDYQYVLKEIEKFVFSFAVGENIMTV